MVISFHLRLIAFQVWSKGGKHRNNRKDNKIDIGIQTETANDEVSDQVLNKKYFYIVGPGRA